MKKINLKFIPLLALTFILSNSYSKNIFAVHPDAVVKEVAQLDKNLWHYRRDSFNIQNLNQILPKINPQEDPDRKVIAKVENILKDLYQGYLIGYANKEEKLSILRTLSDFTKKYPENTIIKALEHKARRSVLSLDDLIKDLPGYRSHIAQNASISKTTPNLGDLIKRVNKASKIDFLSNLLLANKEIKNLEKITENEYQIKLVTKKIQELKNYGWIRRNRIKFFADKISIIKQEENKVMQLEAVQAIIDLNLHKVSGQHAQLTYDLLYNILYV